MAYPFLTELCITNIPNNSFFQTNEFWSAFMGGVFALIAASIAIVWDRYRRNKEHQELIKSILEAILTELITLFDRYKITIEKDLANLRPDSSLNFYYYLSEDYLTVFNGNARMLGHLRSKELMHSIISTYIKIKVFIDSIRLNDKMLSKHESLKLTNQDAKDIQRNRNEFGGKLKQQSDELNIQIPNLIDQIKKALQKNYF